MKKTTFLLIICCFFATSYAQYPQSLPIDHNAFFATSATGSSTILEKAIYATTSATIQANQWNRSGKLISGEGAGISPALENSSLNYSNYIDNNAGKAIILDANIQPEPTVASSTFRSTIYSLTSASEYVGTFYIGMLVNFSATTGSGVDFLCFDSNHTGNSQRGRVFVKPSTNSGNYIMGVGFSGVSDILTWSQDLAYGTTYFIVLKYTAAASGTESASLYVNPNLGQIEANSTPVNTVSATAALLKIRGITIRQRPGIGGKLAGLRFSNNWADVAKAAAAALPQLSTVTVGSASSITSSGFTANWTAVANATGYDVKVYLGTNLISTTNVSGQSTSSVAITGLMSGISYSYKVIAKGDAVNYNDSEISSSSNAFSTLDPYAANSINTNFDDGTWGTAVTTQPTAGTYSSGSYNGFDFNVAMLYERSLKGIKGETHLNRIAIDKQTNGGKITFPTVNSVEQIEIHASAGTEGNGFQLKEFVPATNSWSAIGGTYVYDLATKNASTDSIYIISVSRTVPTKFRIENPTSGGIYIMKIITRTTNPTLLAKPTVSAATGITATGFTANWLNVANATGYNVYVYLGTTLVAGAPFTANGQTTENLAITGLTAETAYTYKVQALGNNDVTYSDSFLSFAASVTTSTTTGLQNENQKPEFIVTGKSIIASVTGNFEIFNLQGKRIFSANSSNRIDTNLATGLYIVNFTNTNGQQYIQKIAIK